MVWLRGTEANYTHKPTSPLLASAQDFSHLQPLPVISSGERALLCAVRSVLVSCGLSGLSLACLDRATARRVSCLLKTRNGLRISN